MTITDEQIAQWRVRATRMLRWWYATALVDERRKDDAAMTEPESITDEQAARYTTRDEESGYETLLRPDGAVVATLTEPEDRCFFRDLAPIPAELNALLDERDELLGRVDKFEELCRLERITVDRLIDERAALRAELEGARAVVDAARRFMTDSPEDMPAGQVVADWDADSDALLDALAAYDAAQDAPAQEATP